MKIESYNNNRYIHVTDFPSVDFWWDNLLQQFASKSSVQQLVLNRDEIALSCATICAGSPINCCEDSLLANNLDCLFTNDYECIVSN